MDDKINYSDRFGVEKTVLAGLFLKKPDIRGRCYCSVCNVLVNYERRGKHAWTDHMKTTKHFKNFTAMVNNTKLTSDFFGTQQDSIENPG